jgi:hypothetical protein
MKFVHFTAPDGTVVAIDTGGNMILTEHHKVIDPDEAMTVIMAMCGYVKVRETMAEVEERLK